MQQPTKLKITAPGERELVVTRTFDAPRRLVFDAWTRPELLRRWLSGPPQWSWVTCEVDLRVGGSYRFVWRNDENGMQMGMGGVYREIAAPERLVATEKFDISWYPGEALGTIVLTEKQGVTTLTQTLLYESRAARDAVLQSPMEQGLAAGYDRLAEVLASIGAKGAK
jgi:uncharacterized protein YndB with AHSA1/START domain